MNYKVIVVDDEPRVRRGLTSLIPRLDQEWAVIGEAKNGLEAIELVRKEMPDLVITDIRMPHMNGLDLLSALKEYPVEVVILSGYGYFEYAQTAVKFGAFDFLLKPLKPSDIENLLARLKTHLQSVRPSGHNPAPLHITRQWKDWLTGSEDTIEIANELQTYLPADINAYQMMTIEIDQYEELIMDDQWGDKQLVLFAVRNVVHEVMTEKASSLFLFTEGSRLHFLILNQTYCRESTRQLITEVRKWVKMSISIGLSRSFPLFSQLPEAYREAKEALQNKWIYGGGNVYDYEEVAIRIQDDAGYPADIDEALVRAVRASQSESSIAELDGFMTAIKDKNLPFRVFRRFCLQLLSSILRIVYEKRLQECIVHSSAQPQDLFQRDFTADEFEVYMKEQIAAIIKATEWQLQQKQNQTLEKAVEYIRCHYGRDISLDDVAEHTRMSGSYFSSFFKQETGETFIEYLTRLRMEKAKSLMMNAELRLYEIARLVGYQDVKYFSRLFKRHLGVTPAEYRQFFYRKED
mgnify:CR=1 FL=1|jgi:Response regulator containing CheY-like receiver domain and AraC-type DNA-binding domain